MSKLQVKRALISVYYKEKIVNFAKFLESKKIEIISTGGTYRLLKKNNIKSVLIDDFTAIRETYGGKIKTLHPLVYGAILSKRDNKPINEESKPIDLVIVNFYPYENLVKAGERQTENLIEMIDIGGPTLLRAASKNYKHVCPVPSAAFYKSIIDEIEKGGITLETRLKMVVEVFKKTAYYDKIISETIVEGQN